jgi:hypothetical protein
LSGVYVLSFCFTSLIIGLIPNLCSITSIEILGISDVFQAKTSILSQRKVTSSSSYLSSSLLLIVSCLPGSLGST